MLSRVEIFCNTAVKLRTGADRPTRNTHAIAISAPLSSVRSQTGDVQLNYKQISNLAFTHLCTNFTISFQSNQDAKCFAAAHGTSFLLLPTEFAQLNSNVKEK